MGLYLEIKEDKQKWLDKNAESITREEFKNHNNDNEYPICLIENAFFQAAAVAYCEEERDMLATITDRLLNYYKMSKQKVKENVNPVMYDIYIGED